MTEYITDKQYNNACRSANLWFVGMYMEAFLLRYDELTDEEKKKDLIEEIYDNGENTFDKNITGTTTRVDSLYRIIRANRIEQALARVVDSKTVARQNPQSVMDAADLLKRIKRNIFKYEIL